MAPGTVGRFVSATLRGAQLPPTRRTTAWSCLTCLPCHEVVERASLERQVLRKPGGKRRVPEQPLVSRIGGNDEQRETLEQGPVGDLSATLRCGATFSSPVTVAKEVPESTKLSDGSRILDPRARYPTRVGV